MKDILKYSIWAGLYAVLIVPFIVVDNMFFPYITGKAFAFRIIVEIILGLWLILIMKDEEFRPKFSWVFASAGVLTFVLLLADIMAVAPFKAFWSNNERMEGWVTIVHLFAYLLVLGSMLNKEKLWSFFLRANVAFGLVMAISSLAEGAKDNITRVAGPLGNPIYIGVYFLFIFFFALILLYRDVLSKNLLTWLNFKKVFSNVLLYVYLISAGLSLYITYRTSRGVLLGAIGGIFVAAILIAIFEKEKKVVKQISLGVIVAVIAVVVVFLSVRDTQFVKSNPTLSRLAEVSWSNVNGQARQYVWPMAIKGFEEKPIFGWGQDGFNYVFNKYYDPRMYGQEQWFDRAHNAPLDFLVAGGILGLLAYLSLFGSALYLLWFRKNRLDITERAIISGLLIGYLFQALFVFDNLISYVMFFIALAYIHSNTTNDSVETISKKKEVEDKAEGYIIGFVKNSEYQNYILIPIVTILTVIGVWWINIPAMSANTTLIEALRLGQGGRLSASFDAFKQALSYHSLADSEIREQLISITPSIVQSSQVDNKTKQDFVDLTASELEKQIARVPQDARYYILMGSFLNSIGNYDKALPVVRKAIELSPKKQTMRFELVQTLLALGKKDEALAEAKSAYELDINYDQARAVYEEVQSIVKK